MWCKECRQDVPGISSASAGGLQCARCGETLSGEPAASEAAKLAAAAANGLDLSCERRNAGPYPSFEDWQIDQNVRDLQAKVGHWKRLDRPIPIQPIAS